MTEARGVALAILTATLALALTLGIVARGGRDMNLEQWTVGGRRFGTVFMVLLMAGEIYTTFTLLGGSGWAYGKGAPAMYILAYGTVAYVMSYWLLPAIWRYGKAHGLVSQSDFFAAKYGSRALGVLVAVVGVVAMIPYLVLQLRGLGIIVSEASYGLAGQTTAIWLGTAAVVAYVVVSGIRGSAWTAAVKDVVILVVVVALGIYLPVHHEGGIGAMFRGVDAAHPGFLTLPSAGLSPAWFVSTVALTAVGFYMWPHAFGSVYSARDAGTFRRSAAVMPLYQLVNLFVFFVGFTAVLEVPGLKGADGDLALFRLVKQTFGPWIVGVVGSAGLLTALVPGSMILMAAATGLAKNVVRPAAPALSDDGVARLARWLVPVVAGVAIAVTLGGGTAIVPLLLMGYSMVTQLFPSLLASLAPSNPVTAPGAIAGIVAGELAVAAMTLSGATLGTLAPAAPQALRDVNGGVVALGVNVVVMGVVSLATRRARVGAPAAA